MEKAIVYSFESRKPVETEKAKRLRIRWNRVALALGVAILLIYGAISLVLDVFDSISSWAQAQEVQLTQKAISEYDQVKVVIESGDTAWMIQSKLTPNERDLRHPLYLAKSLNPGVQMGDLRAGQVLIMLKEKSDDNLTAQASK
ncbi:hypothetical protein ACFVS2_21465 [Brevibacillus sp. NPDC058079]|uniref:hypothetical protein n=1 Tax=Brevibacillus sp. NPDC058079 TaxID=3346330 RepID=UPI0036E79E49